MGSKLHEKIAKIQGELGIIAKNGVNKGQGYNFANEQAFLEAIRPLTSAAGVSMIVGSRMTKYTVIEKEDGKKFTYIAECDCTLTLTDSETGEAIVVSSSGAAHDSGDKAIYKAITGCSKYAYWKAFALATGDDPESRDDDDSSPNTFNERRSVSRKGGLI